MPLQMPLGGEGVSPNGRDVKRYAVTRQQLQRIRELAAERDALKARVAELEAEREYMVRVGLANGIEFTWKDTGGGRESGGPTRTPVGRSGVPPDTNLRNATGLSAAANPAAICSCGRVHPDPEHPPHRPTAALRRRIAAHRAARTRTRGADATAGSSTHSKRVERPL